MSSRSRLVVTALALVAISLSLLALSIALRPHHRSGGSAAGGGSAVATYEQQLKDAGYTKVKDEKRYSGEAGRDITDQRWERVAAPEVVILSDDTSKAEGDLAVNAITFTGADGNGNLTCQPLTSVTALLQDLIADGQTVRKGVQDGTLEPQGAGGFPYAGKLVGCLR